MLLFSFICKLLKFFSSYFAIYNNTENINTLATAQNNLTKNIVNSPVIAAIKHNDAIAAITISM